MNIQDFVKASHAVYLDDEHTMPSGWKLIMPYRQTDNGYIGAAYQLPGGEIIIAHAGTETDPYQLTEIGRDLANDITLGLLQKAPIQWYDAQDFVQEVMLKVGPNAHIYHTGHSLGGVIAQLSAYEHGQKATVFESPGVEEILLKEGIHAPDGYSGANSIQVYNIRGSMISDVGSQITDVQYCDIALPGERTGIKTSHDLDNFNDAFLADGSIRKTLQNPDYLNDLIQEKWEENELVRRSRMHGEEYEVRLHDQYASYEDYRQAYISQHSKALGLPTGASAANDAFRQQLLDAIQAKLERFIQTVQAF